MDNQRKLIILARANANLQKLFPAKYVPISLDEIELVYARMVLSVQADAKTIKGAKRGYLSGILYLAPTNLSGIDVCPMASEGCKASCLFSAGRGRFQSVTRARMVKTLAYHFDRARFADTVKKSIRSLLVKAKNKRMVPVVRLNGTSDILFERLTDIIQSFPDVTFYDYSKVTKRLFWDIPANYHLTFSLSESNESDAKFALSKGYNVAAVFRKDIPESMWGYPVISGDQDDLRFLDPKGVIVGLKAKGAAKKDQSGFVIDCKGVDKSKVAA